jgi:cbb3-type cytochrome oxidase subunit 3
MAQSVYFKFFLTILIIFILTVLLYVYETTNR